MNSATLGLYLWLAVSIFKTDKVAYVFDTSGVYTRGLVTQVRSEFSNLRNTVRPIIEGFDTTKKQFDALSQKLFKNEPAVEALVVLTKDSTEQWELLGTLKKEKASELEWNGLVDAVWNHHTAAQLVASGAVVGIRYNLASQPIIVIARMKSTGFEQLFQKNALFSTYLVDSSGKVLASSTQDKTGDFSSWNFYQDIKTAVLTEKTIETTSPDGTQLLASFASIGVGDLSVITLVEKVKALGAVETLLSKSILFFVALLSTTVLVSVFASKKLTAALRELLAATQQMAAGNFNTKVSIDSSDEVGNLAKNFNHMASEVSRLMTENFQKARMEKELETAKTVQETLFPTSSYSSPTLDVAGYYQPASECGGDWWHYCEIGKFTLIWIGDVTGHGAAAALVTSAARSAVAVLEKISISSPSEALKLLDLAIQQTSKGSMMMTFFLAAIDRATGELVYSNASHNPPLMLKHTGQPLVKKDFRVLNANNGRRLGESDTNPTTDSPYQETTLQLAPGDRIIFFTDGALDLKNESDEAFGRSRWQNLVLKSANRHLEPLRIVELIRVDLEDFRKETPLPDDVTFVVCRFKALTV